ncbi:protein TolR [Aestuariirhabdus litorea]|uniref:Tol-Pal system protein TolR n=1 Tax=Aestuariirhabdus litorea TaxID=2528527 RepID=A0A3P3VR78_9GAMM|nr:protein TolR [Aestuariirhabdus litorea]RRJ84176.1 protein TolR [Aestuariirhabdus litorea]RWW97397.1 protein TolR [Endozoicomonadaceae bacterium GTF-13]
MAKQRQRRRPISEINVVPYIDVMMVLLIVFMVAAPLLTQGVNVELPKTNAKPMQMAEDEEVLILSVKADGSYYLNIGDQQEQPITLALLGEQVSKIVRAQPQRPVMIKGDQKVPYGAVVTAMATLQESGVDNVGLITDPKEL